MVNLWNKNKRTWLCFKWMTWTQYFDYIFSVMTEIRKCWIEVVFSVCVYLAVIWILKLFHFICKLNKCFEVNGVRFHCRRKRYGKGSTRMNPVVELEWRYQWNSWLSYYSQKCVHMSVSGLPISLLWDSFLEVIIYSTSPSQGPGLLEKMAVYIFGAGKKYEVNLKVR